MDFMSNIFSCAINLCCFKILYAHENKYQFCGKPNISCRNGLFIINNLLNMQNNHNLPTFVAFVNIVKSFGTAGYKLLIKAIKRYRDTKKFLICYSYNVSRLDSCPQDWKYYRRIFKEVGVRQGDNMAPVLFLFLYGRFF